MIETALILQTIFVVYFISKLIRIFIFPVPRGVSQKSYKAKKFNISEILITGTLSGGMVYFLITGHFQVVLILFVAMVFLAASR